MIEKEERHQYEHHVCDENCFDCIHRGSFSGNENDHFDSLTCEYLGDTGKLRPCPAGSECTVKVVGKRIARYGK